MLAEDLMAPRDDDAGTSGAVMMQVDVAVLKTQVGNIDKKLDDLKLTLSTSFATKTELAALVDDVKALKSNQSWLIKIVVGAVLAGVLSIVVVKGGVH